MPDGATVVSSARTACPRSVRVAAEARGLNVFDATCPLVTKVHVEIAKMHEQGREIVMIGHAGHPEVEGTMGQCDGGVYLVESVADVAALDVRDPAQLAYVTQTTLSVDDAAGDRRGAEGALSRHRRAEEGRHLLCDAESPGRRQVDESARRRGDRRRQPEQLQLQSAARGRRESRRAGVHGRQRERTAPEWVDGQAARRRHGRRVGAGSARARRSSSGLRALGALRRSPRCQASSSRTVFPMPKGLGAKPGE